MNFRTARIGIVCGLATLGAFAAPVISDVQMTQDPATRAVTVRYTLTGGPAVITAGVTTNGVPTSDAYIARTYGDVHQVVRADGEQVFTWLHRGVTSFAQMTDLSLSLREKLDALGAEDGKDYTLTLAIPGSSWSTWEPSAPGERDTPGTDRTSSIPPT